MNPITRSERTYCDAKLKRLEAGTYQLPATDDDSEGVEIDATDLALLLNGIDIQSAQRRKRYSRAG